MKIFNKIFIFVVTAILISISGYTDDKNLQAQDIPELHMMIIQGDIYVSGIKNSDLDGLELTAKINNTILGSVIISDRTASSRFVSLQLGPNEDLEGENIEFWIGNQMAAESIPFGPTTPSGSYCKGCSWVLPLSVTQDLNFSTFPQATPTPVPDNAAPAFITGNVIFGSILSAPAELTEISAYIDGLLVGQGSVMGPTFSITIDPGTVDFTGKTVVFKIAGTDSKTTYSFVPDDFITDFKLFFPEYVPPTPTPTVVSVPTATQIPLPTSTPEPTRTPTPVPQPTATYTATPTPTPIVLSTSSDNNNSQIILEDSDTGGCNSRGGGAASLSLIVLSAAPLYLLNRRRRKS